MKSLRSISRSSSISSAPLAHKLPLSLAHSLHFTLTHPCRVPAKTRYPTTMNNPRHQHFPLPPSIVSSVQQHPSQSQLSSPTPAAPAPTAEISMDPRVWRRLPPPLVDRVLACLPTPSFLRCRAACRRFYHLLFSSPFLHSHLLLSPHLPFFAFLPHHQQPPSSHLLLFNPTAQPQAQAQPWSLLPLPLPAAGRAFFAPAAASGGLLAFVSSAPGHKTLLLVNPITRLLAALPLCPGQRLSPTVGLAAGPTSIVAVVAGDDLVSPFAVKNISADTFVADAGSVPSSGFWRAPASLLPRLSSLDPRHGMAFASGRFYCMSEAPYAVLEYDVAGNAWRKLQPPMRRFLRWPALVELGGHGHGREGCSSSRVGLVACVEKSRLSVPRSVRVWTLRNGTGTGTGNAWSEVARMPEEIHARFAAAEAGRGFECAAHGDFVVLAPRGGNSGAAGTEVLVFDAPREEWRWAPPCPYVVGGGGGFRVVPYEPRLATPAVGLLDAATPVALQHGMHG